MRLKRLNRSGALILAAFSFSTLRAQQYVFREYGAQQGLASLSVTAVLEDHTGFLWIGTRNGLFRFDGHSFRAYGREEGLPHPQVLSLHQSADGVIWVGTWGGLAWSDGAGFRASQDALLRFPIPVEGLGSDAAGNVYVATRKGIAIGRLNKSREALDYRLVENPPGSTDPFVTAIFVEPAGSAWFGCGLDICRLESSGVARFSGIRNARTTIRDRWQYLLADREGTLWARKPRVVAELRRGATEFIFHGEDEIPPIFEHYPSLALDNEGRLLAPTHRGLAIRDRGAWRLAGRRAGMPVNSLTAVLCDREGTIWLGTEGAGLLRWNGYGEWEAYTEAEGLAGDRITELLPAPGGAYWAGTDGGLNIGHPEGGRWVWKLVPIPGVNMVRDLELGPDGALWISSPAPYIIRYVPSRGRIDRIPAPAPEILGLAFDASGALWAASNSGIFRSLAPGPGARFERCEPGKPGVRFSANEIETDADGAVWVSTFQGLLRFDGKQWRVFNESSGLRSTLIANLARAADGGIWLTYFDPQGISHVRFENGRLLVQHFDRRNGLPGDHVDFVQVDSAGRVWAGTNRGAVVRDGREWLIFNRESGLIWDETATLSVFPDGRSVWIGTARGLSLYTPRGGLKPPPPPGIAITGVVAGGEELRTSPHINFARTQADSLLFRFSALSHRHPVFYQYRLIGFDTEWRNATGTEASYSFLPRRRYRFEVRARSPGTEWSAQPASFEIDVRPPVPLSVWLSILAAVLIGIGGRYYWRRRLRRVELERQLLECRVAERTVELSTANQQLRKEIVEREKSAREKLALEEQLRHSQKMEALGRLAGGVAHDFNNLLTVINGYSQLALRKVEPEHPVRRQISEILDAGQRATDLTRQLLAFSRKQAVERKPVELNRTVADLRNLLARLADDRVKLVVKPFAKGVTVLADPGQLQQVLMNLAVNARDAMPDGGVLEIETGMEPDSDNGRMMGRLSVRDSGVGMTEEVRQRIFEPFFTTKESGRGTGLGLALVYGIVQQHGGVIRVTSEPGHGACFDILLPLAETPAQDTRRPLERTIVGGSEVILLVEDQPEVRALAADSLRSLGYEVVEAAGSAEAEKACTARDGKIHLLLSDIVMPGRSGYELAARLTAAWPHLRVLLTSGYAGEQAASAAGESMPFLPKPYTPESLALKVREVLDSAPRRLAPAPAADPPLAGNAVAPEAGPRATV